jgi:hypothetical protein
MALSGFHVTSYLYAHAATETMYKTNESMDCSLKGSSQGGL